MNPAWVSVAIALITVIVTFVVWLLRRLWRMFTRVSDFLEDWNGRKGDGGHKRIPGAMERLANLEDGVIEAKASAVEAKASAVEATRRIDNQDMVLDQIHSEVSLNSGHSLKDTVEQILRQMNRQPLLWLVGRHTM